MVTDVECELLALLDFLQTGLLTPTLRKRLANLPEPALHIALRDLLDWLSLRSILRGRTSALGSRVHPLTGRVVARLESLAEYLCVPDGCLAYRVEVPVKAREILEDFVKEHIWHPSAPVPSRRLRATPLAMR